ncbi:MAG: hypothetical protein KC646_07425 [Candidatus Cloacimonetes bacterium]|nr:hypothetical protein [Candidatus Cloacimonadota bacterium]
MNVTFKIKELDKKVSILLSKQVWPKNLGSSEYFNKTTQGERFDDKLYSKVSSYLLPSVSSILDIGAGEGKLAEKLMYENYEVTCVEPSVNRFSVLQDKQISSVNCNFHEINTTKTYDCLILLRSIGIASKIGDQFSLFKTLQKILAMAKSQAIIISKAIEDKDYVPMEFQSFGIFNKKPWVFHYDMLKLMQASVTLSFISIEVDKPYSSIEDCIKKDFVHEDHSQVKKYLSKYSYYQNQKFYRKVRLMFPIVDLIMSEELHERARA